MEKGNESNMEITNGAQFSTMCYKINLYVYTCNHCKNHVETRYHCTVCDVRFYYLIFSNRLLLNQAIYLLLRTLICAFHVIRKLDIHIKWNVLVSTWTMDLRQLMDVLNRIHKKLVSNQFNDAFNRSFTLVNVAMQIVVYHHAPRWREL